MIKDDGDAKITSLSVVPAKVNYGMYQPHSHLDHCVFTLTLTGSDFEIDLSFSTVNGTGTGEIDLEIDTVDGIPLGQNNLWEPQPPGSGNAKWTVTAAQDPDCDPTQGPCEMWLPGNYTVKVGELFCCLFVCVFTLPWFLIL